jgi:hypothetical protein
MKELALDYRLLLNWSVFPLCPATKMPYKGFKWVADHKLTTRLPSVAEIKNWWNYYPEANIGLATGNISGVIVFDVDDSSAHELIDRKGTVTTVVAQTSTSDKLHYYYKLPDKLKTRSINKSDKKPICVKANGGYVQIPPSKHPSGLYYKWIRDPFNNKIAELDYWQLKYVEKKKNAFQNEGKYTGYTYTPQWVVDLLKGVYKGERDNAAFRLACYYNKVGLDYRLIVDKLWKWNYKNKPPLKLSTIEKCIRSAKNRAF